jgi:hypothetical protein
MFDYNDGTELKITGKVIKPSLFKLIWPQTLLSHLHAIRLQKSNHIINV